MAGTAIEVAGTVVGVVSVMVLAVLSCPMPGPLSARSATEPIGAATISAEIPARRPI
jgi:hypothetical protein